MGTTHSKIGASGLYRWSECPGSVALCKNIPPRTNDYAEEGTLAHETAEKLLRGETSFETERMFHSDEFLSAVKVYVDLIEAEKETATFVKIEHPFDMSHLYPGLFGTCDAVSYHQSTRTLRVIDYKHGKGHFVKVEENQQLQYYALGALLTLPVIVDTVELVICQPRCPRKGEMTHYWSFPLLPTMLDFLMFLESRARATEQADAPLKEGAWCFFCPAVGTCPEQHRKRIDRAIAQFSSNDGNVENE